MFQTIPHGERIPVKVWMQATDVLADYVRAGEAFVASGRPCDGPVFESFLANNEKYNQMADAIWFAKWTKEQRNEWSRIINGRG